VFGNLDTIMAGLACGKPSIVAWHELNHAARAFIAIPDEAAIACRRPCQVSSGVEDPEARKAIGMTTSSRVLTSNTERAADPLLLLADGWTSVPK